MPLCVLPSALWRLTVIGAQHPLSENLYFATLSVVSMSLACLTLGLVQLWGERVPLRVPLLGGRPIPARVVVTAALLGAFVILALCAYVTYNWLTLEAIPADRVGSDRDTRPLSQRPEAVWVLRTYSPILAWPPLLVAVTIDYYRRRIQR